MQLFPGFGTCVNVIAVLIGTALGVLFGHRLPQRTRDVVTDALGLVVLLIAALSASAVRDAAFVRAVGENATVLIVLGALAIGGIAGSLLRLEHRLESAGHSLQRRLAGGGPSDQRRRFVDGFVAASLVMCVGPLAVLGSISDGLGLGPDQLLLKSAADGIACIAFAAVYGWGVGAAALPLLIVQGSFTLVGMAAGEFLSDAQVAALTATGGLLLVGIAVRLMKIKPIAVGDLLPALVAAPLLTAIVASFVTS